jgi:drug/metabolite transporter (DMT)-like permease
MSDTAPSRASLAAGFATIYLVWGSTYLGIRIAIETLPPFAMASARFLLAGVILFTFLRLRGTPWPTAAQWRHNALAGTFLLLGGNGGVVWAEQTIPSGIAALIIGVGPLFMVLTEWAWKGGAKPDAGTATGLLLGFAGVAWLAAPWESDGALHLPGVLAILGACLSWSIGSIYGRHAPNPAPPFMAAALQMLGGGAALALAALVHGDLTRLDPSAFSARSLAAFAYLTLAGSLVAFSTFVWLMKHSTPARVSTYAYVNPVVAVFLGWLVAHEPVGPRTLMGASIIVGAVALIVSRKAAKQAS